MMLTIESPASLFPSPLDRRGWSVIVDGMGIPGGNGIPLEMGIPGGAGG
jgi:hypothetical protein